MRNNWAMYTSFFKESRIDNLVEFIESNYELTRGSTLGGDIDKKRKSKVAWVGHKEEDAFLRQTIWAFALEVNSEAFGFDIQLIPPIQYTVYESDIQGRYDWHRDTFFTNTTKMYDRKLTFILQLSHSDEYEGGNLILDNEFGYSNIVQSELRSKGTAFIFPSFIRHKVTPVTKGTRKAIVAWIEGPKFR